MNNKVKYAVTIGVGIIVLLVIFLKIIPASIPVIDNYNQVDRLPRIYPDYTGTVIPPNIAPLNFRINEPGAQYYIKVFSKNGESIDLVSDEPNIIIPVDSWKELLSNNLEQELYFEIYIKNSDDQWQKYKKISNRIAKEKIDSYLAYRLLHPCYHYWQKVGIYQRNLETYDEKPVLLNSATDQSCMNCHSFRNNDPNSMMLHLRGGPGNGTLISQTGKTIKVNTATAFNKAGSYPAWHPDGKMIAFSVNDLILFFHAVGESRDVLDRASDLVIYDINNNTITTCPEISDSERMETFPAWSPDGKYLYFCSAPKMDSFVKVQDGTVIFNYFEIRYDLMRIRYESETKKWGSLETVLSSAETEMSITEPRISPDGRYLLFTGADYSNFPIYLKSSDVYLLDLETGKYFKPNVNTDQTESFHSWSSNSRWFVFSSKRDDGFCARPYFSYLDKNGKAYKPFVMPQKDPEFYSGFLTTYNVPELITGPINVSPQKLIETAYDKESALQAKLDPNVKPRSASNQEEANRGQRAPQ